MVSLLFVQVLFLSVCFRQTSIVWLVFVAGTVGIRALQESDIKNGGLSSYIIIVVLLIIQINKGLCLFIHSVREGNASFSYN